MARPPRPEVFDCRDCGEPAKSKDVPWNYGRRCLLCWRLMHAEAQRKRLSTEEGVRRAKEASRRNYERKRAGIPSQRDKPESEKVGLNPIRRARWYLNNKDRALRNNRRWRHTERGKNSVDVTNHLRRLTVRSAGTLTADEWAEIKRRSGGRCYYCKLRRPLTMDHVTPLSKGGAHAAWNVVAACKPCNSSKGAKRVLLL